MKSLKNQKGSALIVGLTLLPVFLTLIFCLSYFLHFLLLQTQVQKVCFTEPRTTQKYLSGSIDQLLSLNPQAFRLKTQKQITQAALMAAIAGLPYTAATVARLKLQLQLIKNQQLILDRVQKGIIQLSSLTMRKSLWMTHSSLQSVFQKFANKRPWLEMGIQIRKDQTGGLAVRPETSELAPTYRLKSDFVNQQALGHSWHIEIKPRAWLSHWMDKALIWQSQCATSLEKEGDEWTVKSNQGKSFSSL